MVRDEWQLHVIVLLLFDHDRQDKAHTGRLLTSNKKFPNHLNWKENNS